MGEEGLIVMKSNREDTILFNSFLQRLRCNAQSFHIILYSTPKGFEYNLETGHIRPLNSVLWYDPLKREANKVFASFLSSFCKSEFEHLEDDGCQVELLIGTFLNGCLSVDFDRLESQFFTHGNKHNLRDSFLSYRNYLEYLYDRNATQISNIIFEQQDLL